MVNVGIIGHTGKTGKSLVNIINNHPKLEIVYTESKKLGIKGNLSKAELVFLALPHDLSKDYLPKLSKKLIIDLSRDHRGNKEWIYGLSELNKNKIKDAKKVANPGCYATSIILGLAPLKGNVDDILIFSSSGISGAGLNIKKEDNFKSYEEGISHFQIKEIEEILNKEILFFPKRIDNTYRGLISNISAKYNGNENLEELYNKFYKSNPFVRIVDKIETKSVNNTNFCNIKILKFKDKLVIISALDNLIKGGAGQAIQNFNIMYGLDETMGLL